MKCRVLTEAPGATPSLDIWRLHSCLAAALTELPVAEDPFEPQAEAPVPEFLKHVRSPYLEITLAIAASRRSGELSLAAKI